jgi:hypothetical protein
MTVPRLTRLLERCLVKGVRDNTKASVGKR